MQMTIDPEEPLTPAERKVLQTLEQHLHAVLDLVHRRRTEDDDDYYST